MNSHLYVLSMYWYRCLYIGFIDIVIKYLVNNGSRLHISGLRIDFLFGKDFFFLILIPGLNVLMNKLNDSLSYFCKDITMENIYIFFGY